MLIDVPSDAHLILFRVQSFFTIEEPRAVMGSHLIRLPKEAPNRDLSCSPRFDEHNSQENQSRFPSYFGDSGVRKADTLLDQWSCAFAWSRQFLMDRRQIIIDGREILCVVSAAHREPIDFFGYIR